MKNHPDYKKEIENANNSYPSEITEDAILDFTTSTEKRPCQYTIEEMREKLRRSQEDIKAGRVVTWEELQKEWDTW